MCKRAPLADKSQSQRQGGSAQPARKVCSGTTRFHYKHASCSKACSLTSANFLRDSGSRKSFLPRVFYCLQTGKKSGVPGFFLFPFFRRRTNAPKEREMRSMGNAPWAFTTRGVVFLAQRGLFFIPYSVLVFMFSNVALCLLGIWPSTLSHSTMSSSCSLCHLVTFSSRQAHSSWPL